MKKYRCPCCGEESISLSNKIFCYQGSNGKNKWLDVSGNSCPECGKVFKIFPKRGIKLYIEVTIGLVFLLLMLYLILFINPLYTFVVLVYSFLFPYLIAPLLSINYPIAKYNREERRFIISEPNAKFLIDGNVSKIDNLDIYGIKFHKKTNKVRFHETFTNDLVPVVFHKQSKKQQGELEVTIMKMEFIPEDLLVEGSKFTIVDNGEEIATGKILTVYKE